MGGTRQRHVLYGRGGVAVLALALICLAACDPSALAQTPQGPLNATATDSASPTDSAVASETASATVPPGGSPTATAAVSPPFAALPPATPTATSRATPTATSAPAPAGWKTVLDDEFSGVGVPSHWGLYDGHYGSGPSNNCAAPSQDSAPGDGYLYLTMSYKTSGSCGAGWYEGGMMISDPYYYTAQAVSVRWRILPSKDPSIVRSHHIIPMLFPNDDKTYQWYNAEDDLCESGHQDGCDTFLHDGTAADTGSQVYNSYTIDLTQWHTWRFEQKDGTLIVYIDNMATPVWKMTQGTSVLPNAVRSVALQQECPADACPPASYAGETERLQIDWITIQVPGA